MKRNIKKPIRVKNRTKFFDPNKDKAFVHFSSPESYQSRKMKIEGYETRLYWQFKYCNDIGGQTFFYTLTYADKNLPTKYGTPCFDYEDLRDLFTGGFRKRLLRNYGTDFKYFVGAELGDGKGKRGYSNNPHYHILFFLEPTKNENYVYEKITPEQFRHLVRLYWQGFDQDEGRKDFRTETKYGIAKEGDDIGLVSDFRACMYCAKYVCKDVQLKHKEINIRQLLNLQLKNEYLRDLSFHKDFFHEVIYPLYNTPTNAKGDWLYNDYELMDKIQPEVLKKVREQINCTPEDYWKDETFMQDIKRLCYKLKLWPKYNNYLNERITMAVDSAITEWRNRYCNKCRISQKVGDYALNYVGDLLEPTFQVPDKHGMKERPISMYYYRKLYTTVIYPTWQDYKGNYHKGNPTRVLNNLGIEYKTHKLQKQIEKKAEKAKNQMNIVLAKPSLFEMIRKSDSNTECSMSFQYLLQRLKETENENLYKRYAEYKLVYEGRYFEIPTDRDNRNYHIPNISVLDDYRNFLFPSQYYIDCSDLRLDTFLDNKCENYLPYSEHPYFLRYAGIFSVLDMCADYFFIQGDNKEQVETERIAQIKRFHKKREIKQWYNNLVNA